MSGRNPMSEHSVGLIQDQEPDVAEIDPSSPHMIEKTTGGRDDHLPLLVEGFDLRPVSPHLRRWRSTGAACPRRARACRRRLAARVLGWGRARAPCSPSPERTASSAGIMNPPVLPVPVCADADNVLALEGIRDCLPLDRGGALPPERLDCCETRLGKPERLERPSFSQSFRHQPFCHRDAVRLRVAERIHPCLNVRADARSAQRRLGRWDPVWMRRVGRPRHGFLKGSRPVRMPRQHLPLAARRGRVLEPGVLARVGTALRGGLGGDGELAHRGTSRRPVGGGGAHERGRAQGERTARSTPETSPSSTTWSRWMART